MMDPEQPPLKCLDCGRRFTGWEPYFQHYRYLHKPPDEKVLEKKPE
jgi:hypothetical protein